MSSYRPPLGDPDLLKKRTIANPKFDTVQPVVECGINTNLAKLIQESEKSVKQGKDELFRRVRATTIAAALEDLYAAAKVQSSFDEDVGFRGGPSYMQQQQDSQQYHPQQQGMYGRQIPAPPPPPQRSPLDDEYQIPKAPKKEYLILDVREREEYEACHILGALHYPPTKLTHATNPYTTEILQFKNRENKVIVLYDLEEEIVVGRRVGNIFFEKGVDNVVIISGGLREFVQSFSQLIVGQSPVPIVPKNVRVVTRGGTSQMGSVRGGSEAGGGRAMSNATSHKPKSLSNSLAKPQSSQGGSWR